MEIGCRKSFNRVSMSKLKKKKLNEIPNAIQFKPIYEKYTAIRYLGKVHAINDVNAGLDWNYIFEMNEMNAPQRKQFYRAESHYVRK